MPFAFTWTNTDPADPTAANLLGKDIRDLRASIQERMDSVFCDPAGSWLNSDPTHALKPAAPILGNANKTILLHHSQFIQADAYPLRDFLTRNELYAQNTSASGGFGNPTPGPITLMSSIVLPAGVTITGASIMVDPRAGGAMTATLDHFLFFNLDPGSVLNIATIVTGATPIVSIFAQGGLVFNTGTDVLVFAIVLNTGNGNGSRFYAASISYTTPDCRSTI